MKTRWFKKKKTHEEVLLNDKKIKGLNLVPVGYSLPDTAINEDDVKKKLQGFVSNDIDSLNGDMLFAYIDAKTNEDISYGDHQEVKHRGIIEDIIFSAKQDAAKAVTIKSFLQADKEAYIKERDKLIAISESL